VTKRVDSDADAKRHGCDVSSLTGNDEMKATAFVIGADF